MMENTHNKILALDSLTVGYRTGTVTNSLLPAFTVEVARGESIAIIGENGVGKSTLLRSIAGLQRELGGNVFIKGQNLKEYSRYELAKNIGYISTEPVRVSNMSVTNLVRLGRYPHTGWTGKLTDEDHSLVSEAISMVGIEALADRYINELSDGERQRAMIARTLAQDADILIMDEPTAFLDVRSRYEIVHLLHELSVNRSKTVLFSTHDMLTAIGESDRIWLLFRDSFVEGAPEDLALKGSFEKLFRGSVVKFNTADATFSYSKLYHGKVCIEGDGPARYWTEKAAGRAGYEISESVPGIKIKIVNSVNGIRWIAVSGSSTNEMASLYELVKWLRLNKERN